LVRWGREDSPRVGAVQKRLREEFTKWFAKGYAAVALRTGPGNQAYLLAPWSDFQERFIDRAIMRIREITLQEIRMKLVAPFETSMERTEARRILLVQANVDGVTGWAECVAGESPYYSPEMIDTAWFIFRDFLWPLI